MPVSAELATIVAVLDAPVPMSVLIVGHARIYQTGYSQALGLCRVRKTAGAQ